jgi:PPOX class probable F420-dependent enzyme
MATMSEGEARAAFAAARVARLATVAGAGGLPHVVPVTFVVEQGRVYFAVDAKPKRSPQLKRLRNIEANPHVCLLVDEYAEDWERLWWARADGVARVLADEGARRRVSDLLRAEYPQYGDIAPDASFPFGPVVEISVTRWSGWRWR